jgi:hypothetical protein
MTDPQANDERNMAIALANRLLDEPNCDPDDDLRTLSRWLLRRHETANNHRQTLLGISDMDPATEGDRMLLWAKDALSGYVEETAEVSMKKQQDEINRLRDTLRRVADALESHGNGAFRATVAAIRVVIRGDNITALDVTEAPK